MAINIGPRIGVDGEAQYRSQINNIVQATKTLKAEMEQTAQEFKRSGDAMGGNKAKAEQLTKAIELQRDKVDKLRDMTAKAAEKYGEADTRTLKWKEALAQAQTELGRMETELGDLTPKVKTLSETFADAGNKLKAIGGKISSAGETWTKYISATIAAFKEVDKGTDTLIAKTGATGEALDEMKGAMEELATTIPTDFETAGNAVGEVNTRFGLTGEALTNLSGKFVKFAKLNNTDVSGSVDKVQASMAAWNMDSEKAGDVLDMLNTAGQQTGINVDKLAGSLMTNSTALKEMGFDMESSISLLANLEKNGIDSSTAMTGLQKGLQNAVKAGKPFDVALAEMQGDLKNATTDSDAMARASELFGKKAGPQLAAAIAEGRISLEKSSHTLGEFGGSVENTFQQTVDGADEFAMALNETKSIGADVGKTLLTMAVPAIRKVGEIVKGTKEAWNGLSQSQQETIVKIAGIVAAVGPALVVIGKITSAVGSIMSLAPQITAAIGTASAFVSGTLIPALSSAAAAFAPFLVPTGLIIVGVIAATALIVKNWDKIKKAAKVLWDNLKKAFNGIVNGIKSAAQGIAQKIQNIKALFEVLQKGVGIIIGRLRDGVVNGFNTLKNKAAAAVGAFASGVKEKFNDAVTAAQNAAMGMVNHIKALPGKFAAQLSKIASKVSGFGGKLKDKFKSIGKDAIRGVISGISGMVGKLYAKIKESMSGLVKKAKDALKIKSPSGVLRDEVGRWIPAGVAAGIEKNMSAVNKALAKLTDGVATGISGADGEKLGEKFAAGIANGLAAKNAKAKKKHKKNAAELSDAIVSTADQRLKNFQLMNETTAAYEVGFWRKIVKSCKKGSQAYYDAYSNYKSALQSYNDEAAAAKESLLQLEQEYAENIIGVETELAQNVNELWENYYSTIEQRSSTLSNALGGLFDRFESKTENTTQGLIDNLKSQTGGMKAWAENIKALESRVKDADLMAALREMGPSAAGDIELLTKMSAGQLDEYVRLWKEKMELCNKQAEAESIGLKDSTMKQVQQLKKSAAAELEQYSKTFAAEAKKLASETRAKLGALPKDFGNIGKSAMKKLAEAIAEGSDPVSAEISALMSKAIAAAKKSLTAATPDGGKKNGKATNTKNQKTKWHWTAYNAPRLFTAPTVVGAHGFGDGPGGEIVIGKNTMMAWIRDAVSGGGTTNNHTYGDINVVVNAAPGQSVRELADAVADRIQQQIGMRRRAY